MARDRRPVDARGHLVVDAVTALRHADFARRLGASDPDRFAVAALARLTADEAEWVRRCDADELDDRFGSLDEIVERRWGPFDHDRHWFDDEPPAPLRPVPDDGV